MAVRSIESSTTDRWTARANRERTSRSTLTVRAQNARPERAPILGRDAPITARLGVAWMCRTRGEVGGKYFPLGHRNLWGAALLHFAFDDNWLSHSVASGVFVKGWDFDADMLNGERELLMLLPAQPVVP